MVPNTQIIEKTTISIGNIMAFIDLIADLEDKFKLQIDFETAADTEGFTTLGGLSSIILKAKNVG